MNIRAGDTIFVRTGDPAVVRDRDPVSGRTTLELDPAEVRTHNRHGYLNGMSVETRQQLYDILDAVKTGHEDPKDRIENLTARLRELEADPRNYQLTRYLKAEMVHMMNTYGYRPREYSVHESRAR